MKGFEGFQNLQKFENMVSRFSIFSHLWRANILKIFFALRAKRYQKHQFTSKIPQKFLRASRVKSKFPYIFTLMVLRFFKKNQISDQGFKVFSLKFPNLRGGVLNFFACGAIWVRGFLRKGFLLPTVW